MKSRTLISKSLVVGLLGAVIGSAAAQEPATNLLECLNRKINSLCAAAKDAVVRVHALHRTPVGTITLTPPRSIGTGFFIRSDGTLITAATVVGDAQTCWVECYDHKLEARILGVDPRCNLAVLKIDPTQCLDAKHEMPFLPISNAAEPPVGSLVVAIGYPYELPSAPAIGFIDGWDIRQGNHVFPVSHIRASCRLRPGQAGSPLLNPRGEVVGVAVAAHQDDDCYALPIHAAQKIWTDILEKGSVQHGWVGLEVTERTNAKTPSLLVAQVFSNTPAAQAGFLPGDTLLKIHTNEVRRLADLMNTMFFRHAGERVDFTVLRNNQEQHLTVVVGTWLPAESAPAAPTLSLTPVLHER